MNPSISPIYGGVFGESIEKINKTTKGSKGRERFVKDASVTHKGFAIFLIFCAMLNFDSDMNE